MTVILPADSAENRAAGPAGRHPARPARHPVPGAPGLGVRDYGESLVRPISAVREAAEQSRVDSSLHDATSALDAFTRSLTTADRDIDKWPDRFTAEAKRLRDRFAADIPDGPSRDRFDAGFDLFAKAKAVETRGLATHKRIATNRAELDRMLSGYGEAISRAMNPVSVAFALKQGEDAIRNQVAAQVLSQDEARDLSRRYRTDIAIRRAEQFTQDDPAEAAKELGKGKDGLFADLDGEQRRRLAGHAKQAAAAHAADAERMAMVEERRVEAEKFLRRDAFLRDLDDRADKGAATLADITNAARDGVLDAEEATERIKSLETTLAARDGEADRVAKLIHLPDTFLDPADENDRRAADIHWRDTVLPLVDNLPGDERIRVEDAVVLNTGIAPKPVADSVLAGLLSGEPAPRVAAARRVHRWLLSKPPIPVDIHGLRIPEFETLRPYIDLPMSDARKVALAERDDLVMRRAVGESPPRPTPLEKTMRTDPAGFVDPDSRAEGEGTSFGEANTVSDTGGDSKPEPSAPAEAQARLESALADPETRAALREQLLKDLEAEAEGSHLSPAEVLERQQKIREALPADPAKGTQVAFAPAIAAGAAATISPQALASALAVIGLGALVKGDTNGAGNATQDSISRRVEEDDGGRGRGGSRAGGDNPSDGTSAGDPGEEPPDRDRTGRKARDSSKNERHGDGGRREEELREELEAAREAARQLPRKERNKALMTVKRRAKAAAKRRRGDEHSRREKGRRR